MAKGVICIGEDWGANASAEDGGRVIDLGDFVAGSSGPSRWDRRSTG